MKLQQPRNYDLWMFQFNLLRSQSGNSREMTFLHLAIIERQQWGKITDIITKLQTYRNLHPSPRVGPPLGCTMGTFRISLHNFIQRRPNQKNSRRLWRSRRRKSSSVPAGTANFPAAVFLAGKCPNLGRDSISCCRRMGKEFSSSVEIARELFQQGISDSHSLLEFSDLKALETTTAIKRRKISCSFGSDCWVSDLSFHGCWLGIVVVWRCCGCPGILGRKWCANFMCALDFFLLFLLGNPHANRIPRFRGEGVLGFFGRGGASANLFFGWARDLFEKSFEIVFEIAGRNGEKLPAKKSETNEQGLKFSGMSRIIFRVVCTTFLKCSLPPPSGCQYIPWLEVIENGWMW